MHLIYAKIKQNRISLIISNERAKKHAEGKQSRELYKKSASISVNLCQILISEISALCGKEK